MRSLQRSHCRCDCFRVIGARLAHRAGEIRHSRAPGWTNERLVHTPVAKVGESLCPRVVALDPRVLEAFAHFRLRRENRDASGRRRRRRPDRADAALGLAHYGIPFLLFEGEDRLSTETKAGTTLSRSLEIWRRFGVAAALLRRAMRSTRSGTSTVKPGGRAGRSSFRCSRARPGSRS